jgi:hypothetical protein
VIAIANVIPQKAHEDPTVHADREIPRTANS